jgi:sortase A
MTGPSHIHERRSRSATPAVWIERGLLVIGLLLAIWCAVVLIEAEYVRRLPIPEPRHASLSLSPRPMELPGEPVGATSENDVAAESSAGSAAAELVEAGAWVARLESSRLGLVATVLEGSDDTVLRRAAGHIPSTPLPGQTGNVGIAGHRDTTFRPLRHAQVGDTLRLTTADRELTYVVSSTRIVEPTEVEVLAPTPQPALTLVTCYPFSFIGSAPKRFVVHADLVESRSR